MITLIDTILTTLIVVFSIRLIFVNQKLQHEMRFWRATAKLQDTIIRLQEKESNEQQ